MTRLDELIAELCPMGVESIPMGSLMTRVNERGKDAPDVKQVYAVSNTLGMVSAEEYRENTIHSEDTSNYTVVREGMVAYNPSRLNIGSIAMLKSSIPGLVSPMYIVFSIDEEKVSRRYFEYLMHSPYVANKIDSYKEEGARFRFDYSRWNWILVQIPPKQIQERIVKILDCFTELIEELSAELTARQKQYQYYSKLQFEMTKDSYPAKPISAFGKWSGGKTPSMAEKRFWEDGTIPWISSKDMKASVLSDTEDHIAECALKDASMTLYPKECIAIVTRSGILKHTFPVSFIPFETTVNQDIKILVPKSDVIPKYAFLAMKAYAEDIRTKAKKQGGTVDSLEFQKVLDFEIPLPPLNEQNRIVSILEKFDAISNDITNGLPAEIAARQKQYEYYRDKLLRFRSLDI